MPSFGCSGEARSGRYICREANGLKDDIRKNGNYTLFWRLLLSFASLLLPMILVTLLFYNSWLQRSREELATQVGLNLKASVNMLDANIATTHAAGMMLLDTDSIEQNLRPASVSTPEQKVAQIGVISQIAYARGVTGNIVESLFLFLDDDKVYADGQYDFHDFFDRLYRFTDYPSDFWRGLLDSSVPYEVLGATGMSIPLSAESRAVVPSLIRMTVAGYRIVLSINLSVRNMSDVLESNSIVPGMNYIILDTTNRPILAGAHPDDLAVIQQISADNNKFNATMNGVPSIVIQQVSSFTGWRYFAVIPAQAVSRSSSILLLMLIFALLLVVGLMVSYYFTLKIYRPISRIRNSLEAVEPMDRPTQTMRRNDFDIIGRGIDHLLNGYSAARQESQSLQSEYLDTALLQLLSARQISGLPRIEKFLKRDYGFQAGPFCCVNVLFRFTDYFNAEMQDTERLNLLAGLKSVLWELIKQKLPCYVLEHRENLYVCVLSLNRSELSARAVFEDLIRLLSVDAPYFSAVIGLGGEVNNLADLGSSFEQASSALFGYDGDVSAILEPGKTDVRPIFDYPLQDEMALTKCLTDGEADETRSLLDAILRRNQQSGISSDGFDLLIQELYITGMRFLASRNEILPDINRFRDLRRRGRFAGDFNAAGQLLQAFFTEALTVSGHRDNRGANLSAMLAEYVQKNYSHDLYLEKIAEDMGLSVKYISKVFKEKTGQNLSDYINNVRMEHVKEMLLQTDYPIGKIAEMVGLYSRSTFVRIFRKQEGVTPTEYRDLMRPPG